MDASHRPGLAARYADVILAGPGLASQLCDRAWDKVLSVYDCKFIARETAAVYAAAIRGNSGRA